MLKTNTIGRAGEHYVAAEINRRGAYASPFSGNVPGIDVIATDARQERVAFIQVKTKRVEGHRWPASLSHGWVIPEDACECFCLGTCDPDGCIGAAIKSRNHPHHERATDLLSLCEKRGKVDHYWVFVSLEELGFWVIPDDDVRKFIRRHHTRYLEERGGHRPGSKHASLGTRIGPQDFADWRGRWSVLCLGLPDSPPAPL